MSKNISAVILDLGGVVFALDWQQPARVLGLPITTEWWLNPEYDFYERGAITIAEFRIEMQERYKMKWPSDLFTRAIQSLILQPFKGVEDLLKQIKVPLYALSNTNKAHADFFLPMPVMDHFKGIVTSFEIELRKPEPEAFETTLELLKLKASEVVYVDDRDDNVLAAAKVGMNAEQSINSVDTLREILKKYQVI